MQVGVAESIPLRCYSRQHQLLRRGLFEVESEDEAAQSTSSNQSA